LSLSPFFSRVADALAIVVGEVGYEQMAARLHSTTVAVSIGADAAADPALRAGFLLSTDLLARLYPSISIEAPSDLRGAAVKLVRGINPEIEIESERPLESPRLRFATEPKEDAVTVWASSWDISIDLARQTGAHAAYPAALAAAALGVSELFRTVFEPELGEDGRSSLCPYGVNLLTLGDLADASDLPELVKVSIGSPTLVGAGAIGQAALHTFALSCSGSITVIEPELLELSNLQRYVGTRFSDVGKSKLRVAARTLEGSAVHFHGRQMMWSGDMATKNSVVLTAVDSEATRIEIQSSLPARIYNAWTQPRDLGWSRHEEFGSTPCLACLYWPTGRRPDKHQVIAVALGEHELRILGYLVTRTPIGQPLPIVPEVVGIAPPDDAARWLTNTLGGDLAKAANVDPARLHAWFSAPVDLFYSDAICGGAVLDLRFGELPQEVIVPLAHQSALAGVMLALELMVAQDPALREVRSQVTEARLNVMAAPNQMLPRPRLRTSGCICGDADFLAVYREKHDGER
jgi:hypothetical protein